MICLILAWTDKPEEKRKIEKLYEAYQKLMIYVAYRILNNMEDAEDAVLSSWEKIIKNLHKINEIECKETKVFIVTVVERIAIDTYRRKKRERNVPLEKLEETSFAEVPEVGYAKIEMERLLHSLPRIYSEVLILHYINGYNYAEIGRLLGIKENTVASRVRRAKEMLRGMYGM